MIRTEREYEDALERLTQDMAVIEAQRESMCAVGLSGDEVERALEPTLAFHEQLKEEVEIYERMRRGDIMPIMNLMEIGRILIGLRIAQNMSQQELADRLGVSPSQVSRDERNDYHGITMERAQRIIGALKARVKLEVDAPIDDGVAA